jgi:trans-aconitate methyltransferase
MEQTWDAAQYAKQGRFVADLASEVLELLDARPGERILDLGCGDGVLTQKIAASGATVIGFDSSPEMIEAARALGVDARRGNAEELPELEELRRVFGDPFDAVFSNAALHWVKNQGAMLAGVRRVLKPGGRFVAEMGGHGNIAAIRVAMHAVLRPLGFDGDAGHYYFPTPAAYRSLLEGAGFNVTQMVLVPRQTALPPSGMDGWLKTFRRGVLAQFAEEEQKRIVDAVVELLRPLLCDEQGNWVADYVRLRFVAVAS